MVATIFIATAFVFTIIDAANDIQKLISGAPMYESSKIGKLMCTISMMFLVGGLAAYFMGV